MTQEQVLKAYSELETFVELVNGAGSESEPTLNWIKNTQLQNIYTDLNGSWKDELKGSSQKYLQRVESYQAELDAKISRLTGDQGLDKIIRKKLDSDAKSSETAEQSSGGKAI